MKITDVLLRPDRNNFTLVRLMLASSVIYSHAYEIVSGNYGAVDVHAHRAWLVIFRQDAHGRV